MAVKKDNDQNAQARTDEYYEQLARFIKVAL
jgi:hypothetical protein